jgi:hypothetical protein
MELDGRAVEANPLEKTGFADSFSPKEPAKWMRLAQPSVGRI